MPTAVERIEKILGDVRTSGGLSLNDIALIIARDLGLHPHDPLPNPPISDAAKEDARRAGMSDMAWGALTEAQRDQYRADAVTSAGFTSGVVPTSAGRVVSGGTSTQTNVSNSGGVARATSETVSIGGRVVTSGGTTKATEA